jgi:hypothetical protein
MILIIDQVIVPLMSEFLNQHTVNNGSHSTQIKLYT